jgi:hypothetical protein
LNGYCKTDIGQDKAEIFAYLCDAAYRKKQGAVMEQDQYFNKKLKLMKKSLQKLNSQFSDDYFTELWK